MNTLATIVSLSGQAWAQTSTGERRSLKVGDRLTADEILVTAQGTVVGVDFGNGNELTFVGEQQVAVAEGADISATAKTESDATSALTPLADLPATANDSSGPQYSAITVDSTGHNFVNLVRIHEIIEADGITPVTVARISEVLRPLGLSLPEWVQEEDYRYEHRGEERYENGAIQRVPGLTVELQGAGADGIYNESEIAADGTVSGHITLDDKVKEGDILVVTDGKGNELINRPVTSGDITNGIIVKVPVTPGQPSVEINASITQPNGTGSNDSDEKPVDNLAPELSGSIPDRADEDADVIDLDIRGQFTDQVAPNTELDIVVTGLPKGLEYDPTTGKVTGIIDKSASQNGDGDIPTDGKYKVTITVTDPAGNSSEHDFVWSVSNPPPVAIADANTTLEDVTLTVTAKDGVLANDSDPDGDEPLRVTEFEVGGQKYAAGETAVVSGVGNLTLNADGSYTFVPAPNFNGPVPTVNYTISDGEGGTSSAELSIEVVPVLDIILSATPEVIEGGKIMVTATVESPVADKPLYIELETGEVIVIQVGEITGSIEVDSRSDDPYQQGNEDKTFTVKQAVGGNEHINESSLGSTVTSTIVDDADITRVKVTTTNVTEDEAGVTFVFELNNPPQAGSTVALTVDVNGTEHQVTVDANGRGELFIPTQNSDVYLDADSLTATVTKINGGNFEAVDVIGATATADITDTIDTVIAELTVDRSAVNEGAADLVYTVTLRDDSGNPIVAKNDVTVETSLGTIIIPAGSSTGTLDVPVQGDDVYLDGETVTNTITSVNEVNAGQPGSFENLTFDNSTTTTTVSDTINTVTLTLDNASVNEGSGTAQITASLDYQPETELTVTLSNGATITFGTDYVVGTPVRSTPFPINNGEDVYVDSSSFVVSVTKTEGGNFENLVTTDTATVTVTDTSTSVIAELTVDKTAVSEGAADLIYTVTLKDAAGNLTPANNAVTVETTYGTIVIAKGASSGTLVKSVQGDDVYVDGETLSNKITSIVEANAGQSGSFESLGFDATAVVTEVTDTLTPVTVKLSVDKIAVSEGATDLVYTVTLTDANGNPVIANNAVTVTTSFGDVIIAAGTSSNILSKVVQGDDVYKDGETLTNVITQVVEANAGTADSFEQLGFDGTAVSTVVSDTPDPVYAQITVDQASVLEGGTLKYTVSLVDANGQPVEVAAGKSVDVQLNWGGAAANLDDVDSLPTNITIGAGQSSATFDVLTKKDAVNEYSEPLTATISGLVDQGTVKFEDLKIGSPNAATSNILDAPTITAVDNNGSNVNGQVTVYEKGLNNAADTSETTMGVLRVTAPSGLDSISIAGTTITFAELQNLAGTSQTITIAGHGTLTLTGMTANATSNGSEVSWDISYEYTLTDTQTHADADGTNSLLESIELGVTAKSADGTGTVAGVSGSLGVLVIDDVPQATNDTGTIVEDGANPLEGNVLDNDTLGADTPANPVVEVGFGATSGTIGTALSGAYGQLTLNADGTYTYTLDNDNAAVNALKTGKSLTEEFTYTIKDADGDLSTATIIITINGNTDGTPSIVSNDENGAGISGDITVKESGLSNGSDAVVNTEIAAGTIKITALDGLQSITVGGKSFTLAELNALSSTTPSAAITVAGGTLVVTGFTATQTVGGVPTEGTLNYTYTLTGARTHDKATEDEALTLDISLSVTDAGNTTTSGNLVVRVEDDTPTAVADANSVASGSYATVTGNVISNDTQGADGAKVSLVQGKDAATAISPTGNTVIEGTYGQLIIHSDGTYSYQRNAGSEGGVEDTFTYTLTDGDGDTSSTNLVITIGDSAPTITSIPTAGSAGAIVYEAGLTNGSDSNAVRATTNGQIQFTSPDGLGSVSLAGQTITTTDTPVAGTPGLSARYEYDATTGKGIIHYSYTLQGTTEGDDTSVKFPIEITDTDGDSASVGQLEINIVDDVPTATPDTGVVTEGATLIVSATDGVLKNDKSGADGWANSSNAVVGVVAGTAGAGENASVGTVINGAYGTLMLNADGSYTYVATANSITADAVDIFTYTVKDGDGDLAETTLTINVKDVTGTSKTTTGIVDEAGLTNGTDASSDKEKIANADLNLDTGWTVNGVQTGTAAHGTWSVTTDGKFSYTLIAATTDVADVVETDSFTYTAKDANGNTVTNTVTITIKDDVPTVMPTGNNLDEIVVDETFMGTPANANFSSAFNTVFGADGEQSFAYSFEISNVASDLTDTATGKAITLHTNAAGEIEGRVDGSTTDIAFTISVDAAGNVTLTQNRAVKHPNASNHDDAVKLAADSLKLKATATDGDGDKTSASVAIGDRFIFKDDGPIIGIPPAAGEVDEKYLATGSEAGKGNTTATGNLDVNFGADGQSSVGSLVLSNTQPALRAWLDASSNTDIEFTVTGNTLTATREGKNVFTVELSVDANGQASYSFELQGAMIHREDKEPHELTLNYQAVDGDGDKVDGTFVVNVIDDAPKTEMTITMDEDNSFGPFTTSADATLDNITISQQDGTVVIGTPNADGTQSFKVDHGTVTVSSDGQVTFKPDANYSNHSNPDQFFITVQEDNGQAIKTTVTVNVTPVSDAPGLDDNKTLVTPEDVSIALGLITPTITDNNDQSPSAAGDDPERLGAITLNVSATKATGAPAYPLTGTGAVKLVTGGKDINLVAGKVTIVITDTSGSEVAKEGYHEGNVPAKNEAGGVYYLTQAEYEALEVVPATDRHENITVKVGVTSFEVDASGKKLTDVNGATSSQTITVDVKAVTDKPELTLAAPADPTTIGAISLTVAAAAGTDNAQITAAIKEDIPLNLQSVLVEKLKDVDGSEKYWYSVSGLPEGTKVTIGTKTYTAGSDGKVTMPSKDYIKSSSTADPKFTITPPKDYSNLNSAPIKATITLHTKDADSDSTVTTGTETVSVDLELQIYATPDDVMLTNPAAIPEDTKVKFLGSLALVDTDGSESITQVRITGLPAEGGAWILYDHTGAIVNIPVGGDATSGGLKLTVGFGYTLEEIKEFTLQPPAHSSLDGHFKVYITTQEAAGNTHTGNAVSAEWPHDIKITVTPVAEKSPESGAPVIDTDGNGTADLTINADHKYNTPGYEDEWFTLGLESFGDIDFNLGADWTNEDSDEFTFAQFTPELVAGTGDVGQTDAKGSIFRYKDADGDWHEFVYVGEPIRIPKEFLTTLEFKAVENFSGKFIIKVEAVTVDFDDDNEPVAPWDPKNPNAIFDLAAQQNASVTVSGSASLTNVEIRGVADDITLSLNGFARGKEDQPIDLNINALSSDKSEQITIVINDIPVGATITYVNSDGTSGTFTAQIGSTTLELEDFNGAGAANQPRFPLTYQAPDNESGNFTLNVTAQSEEKDINGNPSEVYTLPVNIFVEGVADDAVVNLKSQQSFTEEALDADGGHVKLTDLITCVTTPDTDGSEVVTVRISGLPEGFQLTGATLLQAGTGTERIWTVAESNLGNVKIETPNNFSGEVTFQVAGVTTETGVAGGNSKTMSPTNVTFVVTPSPEATTTTSAVLVEDVITSLNFDIKYQNGDEDETLGCVFVEKSQLDAAGFTLYVGETALSAAGLGSKIIDGKEYYVLSAEQAKTLAAKGAEHKDGAVGSFDFKYEVTDGNYGAVASVTPVTMVKDGNFTLTATPVTDSVNVFINDISGELGTTVSSDADPSDANNLDTVVLTVADTVTVNMKVTSPDNDGSEHVIRVLIEGVPVGVTVQGAQQIDGNTWVLIYEGAAAQSITAAGIDIPVSFIVGPKVSGQNAEITAKIKMTVQSKDRGNDPESSTVTEEDSVNWHLKVNYPEGEEREPLVVNKWVYKDVGVSEDTQFQLSDILSGTMAEEASVYPNTLTVTLSDVPEGTVIAGMTMTSQQMFDEDGTSLGFKDVWTASKTVPAGSNGQAELDALLQSIEITSPLDKNDNNSKGEFTFNASLSTSAEGGDSQVSEIPKADMVIPVAPVTDEAIITVMASNVAEGSDSIPVTITVAKGVDNEFGEIVDGKAYVQVSNADGVLTLADGTALTIEKIDGEDYYVVQVGKDGGTAGLKYTPNAGVILQPGDVTFTVKVTTQEQAPTGSTDIPAPVTTTETVTSTIEIVNNGVTVESTLVTGNEAASSDKPNAIELTGAGGLKVDLIDADGSEAINVIMLAGLPNGFLVYVGNSAGDATQATLSSNAGGEGTTNTWILSEGVLPSYVAILPPAYWSGTLEDLKLIVGSGEVDLSDKLTESTAIANVVIAAKADGLVINPTRIFGKEGDVITLNLNAAMNDPDSATSTQPDDSTETTSLILTGLGEYAEFFIKGIHLDTSEGSGRTVTYNADGSYTITGLSQDDVNVLGFKQAKVALVDQNTTKLGMQIGVEAWTVESSNGSNTKATSQEATIDLNISNQLAGTGDDTLIWTGQAINGRAGDDTIQLRFGESLSGTQLSGQLKNIEVLDLSVAGTNSISGLTAKDVLDITDTTNTLKIFGDEQDIVTLSSDWTKGVSNDGYTTYNAISGEKLSIYDDVKTSIIID